jgi:hypothetical protein
LQQAVRACGRSETAVRCGTRPRYQLSLGTSLAVLTKARGSFRGSIGEREASMLVSLAKIVLCDDLVPDIRVFSAHSNIAEGTKSATIPSRIERRARSQLLGTWVHRALSESRSMDFSTSIGICPGVTPNTLAKTLVMRD